MSSLSITQLSCEYLKNPIGLGTKKPRLAWKLSADMRGAAQSGYQIQCADKNDFREANMVWDSGKVASDETIHIPYAGTSLTSMQRIYWRVKVWDEKGDSTAWSETAFWEMGLLHLSDWKAQWIEPESDIDPLVYKPAAYLRIPFSVNKPIHEARLYMTAHGIYESFMNGQYLGDQKFMPGITNYRKRLQYQVYDVSSHLSEKENCLAVTLGDGWFRGQINANSTRNTFGTKLALLAQLYIRYEDGTEQWVLSDENWKTYTGPITKSDLKDGETYDARLEMPGWNKAGFDDGNWQNVHPVELDFTRLIASEGSPIRLMETFSPIEIITTPSGKTVLDFGQNIAGIVRMKVSGPAGTTVKLQHSETLDENGEFSLKYLNGDGGGMIKEIIQEDLYILKGEGVEIYEPHFTVHGFRYVLVTNYPGEICKENFTAFAIYSDMGEIGKFSCSNEKLNKLHQNVLWSQKGNFLDIPTDCPTRERAGWTGDAQIFVHAGSLLMNDAAFYRKWIKDVASAQGKSGIVPNFVPAPDIETEKGLFSLIEGSAGWGDAAVIIPWEIYQMFGDSKILEDQYDSMKAWVEYMRKLAGHTHWVKWINPMYWFSFKRLAVRKQIWDTKYHWGEWLEPDIPIRQVTREILKNLVFSQPLIATAYFAYSTRLLAKTAAVLGVKADVEKYTALADDIHKAYMTEFIREDGTIRVYGKRQASYVRAIALGLDTPSLRPKLAKKLANLVIEGGKHLGTGFLSTPFLCYALSGTGYLDLAYDIVQQETLPSWLYAVNQGATTIWEDWDGIDEKGVPHASLNHYSKGAVVSWFYEVITGIQPDITHPGYQHFALKPQPGGGLTHAKSSFDSVRGMIKSAWKVADGKTIYTFTIPANTSAHISLQAGSKAMVTSGDLPLVDDLDVCALMEEEGTVSFNVPSGTYTFTVQG